MELESRGGVRTEVTMENLQDLWNSERGQLSPDQVRRITRDDALVESRSITVALPMPFIKQLGLEKSHEKRVTSRAGTTLVSVYEPVRLTIQGRSMTVDVLEGPEEGPIAVGQIPLGMLDLVIDPEGGRLIGNPAHGGEQMLELY
jgi:hypothetical protein